MKDSMDTKDGNDVIYITEIFKYILWAHEGGDFVY